MGRFLGNLLPYETHFRLIASSIGVGTIEQPKNQYDSEYHSIFSFGNYISFLDKLYKVNVSKRFQYLSLKLPYLKNKKQFFFELRNGKLKLDPFDENYKDITTKFKNIEKNNKKLEETQNAPQKEVFNVRRLINYRIEPESFFINEREANGDKLIQTITKYPKPTKVRKKL